MHRTLLPVVDPCQERFEWGSGGSTRYCDRCSKNVHNLSEMTRREAERFLDRHAGQKMCVQYRVDADGMLAFKPAPRMAFVAIASLALAACTGVGDGYDLDTPDDALMCEDAQGYVIPCDEADGLRIPIAEGQRAEANEGCPVPPPGIEPSVEDDEHRIERGDVAVVPAEPPPPPPGGMMVPTRAERRAFERQARRERRSRS